MKTLTNWGFYRNPTLKKSKIADREHGGVYEYCPKPDKTDEEHHLVKFGNNFDPGWVHPDRVPHRNWHFWDNPEFCHLLYPNPANPQGMKSWVRWVRGEIMTTGSDTPGEDAVNAMLRSHSNNQLRTWRDLYAPRDIKVHTKTALIVTSSPNCYRYYYGDTREQWLLRVQKVLNRLGWQWVVRTKQGRKYRNADNQLYRELETNKYGAVINQHSASTIESLLAGVPVIADRLHCGGPLVRTLEQFEQGADPLTPNTADVEAWMQTILGNVRHKSQLRGTEW